MCQNRTVLALESAGRYIAQCEHGTIHIFWDNLTIRLRSDDFGQLADVIDDAVARLPLQQKQSQGLRLRLRGVLLEFSAEDLITLDELASLAALQMRRPGAADANGLFDLPEMELMCTHDSPSACWRN
jgi:hypothetical protein